MSFDSSRFGYSVAVKEEGRNKVICLKGTLADESPSAKPYKRINLRDGNFNSGWRLLDLTISPTDASENNYNQDWTVQVATVPNTQPIARWDSQGSMLIAYAKCLFGAGALFGNFSQVDTDRLLTYDVFIGAWDEVGTPDVAGINYVMHLEKVPLTKTAFSLNSMKIMSQFDTFPLAPY